MRNCFDSESPPQVDCGRPLCCRTEDGPAKSNLSSAGPFGDYNCDAAPALFESLAHFIGGATELPALDFAVFTGDVPPHDIWEGQWTLGLKRF
jgi:sphingomyelin phosphodiesterase